MYAKSDYKEHLTTKNITIKLILFNDIITQSSIYSHG